MCRIYSLTPFSLSLFISLSLSDTLSPVSPLRVDYANYYAHSVDEIAKVQKAGGANCGHSSTGKKCKKAFFL